MQIQLGKRRRELEKAFEERTAELRTVSECELATLESLDRRGTDRIDSPGGIFRCDGDGEVVYANSAWYV
jgi:PAS domain-containing protein